VVHDAAVKAGAPKGLIGWVDVPSIELTNVVMAEADLILATGGASLYGGSAVNIKSFLNIQNLTLINEI
ncbi:hypothetical protein ACTPEM_25270, partial [Clostridioides difficile]